MSASRSLPSRNSNASGGSEASGQTAVQANRDCRALAAQINAEHDLAYGKAREALEHARRAGELLLTAKRTVAHGAWSAWLQANVRFSERTAQSYMQVARRWPAVQAKTAAVADLTLRCALQEIRKDAAIEKRAERLRALAPPPPEAVEITPAGQRRYRALRNVSNKQWALQALPCLEYPYTETIYFEPLDDTDGELERRERDSIAGYLLDHITSLRIADIDVEGDVRHLAQVEPWSFRLNGDVQGWTRIGNECGPDLSAEVR